MTEQYADGRELGRRATDRHLAQTLPPHGRHAGPSAHSAPHDAAGPGSIIVPSRAVLTPEKSGAVIEAKLASNVRRKGTVQAAEGLAQRDGHGVEDMFAGGFQQARAQRPGANFVEMKIANGRSGLADGHDSGNPTWASAQDPAINFDFMHGTATVRANGNIPPLSARSSVSQVGSDLSRLDLTERGRTSYGKVYGSDAKQVRHNEAEAI